MQRGPPLLPSPLQLLLLLQCHPSCRAQRRAVTMPQPEGCQWIFYYAGMLAQVAHAQHTYSDGTIISVFPAALPCTLIVHHKLEAVLSGWHIQFQCPLIPFTPCHCCVCGVCACGVRMCDHPVHAFTIPGAASTSQLPRLSPPPTTLTTSPNASPTVVLKQTLLLLLAVVVVLGSCVGSIQDGVCTYTAL